MGGSGSRARKPWAARSITRASVCRRRPWRPSRRCRAAPRGLQVLVVDDHKTNARILEEMLQSWGMRPVLVHSGRAALAALAKKGPKGRTVPRVALVITDFQMPGSGRDYPDTEDPPCRLTCAPRSSCSPQWANRRSASASGVRLAASLLKPVKQSDLLRTPSPSRALGKRSETAPREAKLPRLRPAT